MNRRELFRLRRLAHTAGQVLGAVDELRALPAPSEAPPLASSPEITLLTFSRRAMATTFELLVPFGTRSASEAAAAALDEVDRLEDQLTVYREQSEVSGLNRRARSRAVPVEERLFQLLTLAARIHEETEGAYDISTGALTKAWGFFKRSARVPSEEERREVLTRVGMQHVVLDPERQTVRYQVPGLEINLGSIGKGYALDRAAETLRREWNFSSALLHGGHSSVYAIGSEPGSQRGWPVALRHPWDPQRRLGVVRLRDRGLGTSAATFQHLEHQGRKLGHLLDPRTGWPAEGMASATVLAPTAAEADALATAFFLLGVDKARAYCATHPGVGAVLLPEGETATPVVLGLAAQEFA
jgi:thiamine biosynthesis lipoprotein